MSAASMSQKTLGAYLYISKIDGKINSGHKGFGYPMFDLKRFIKQLTVLEFMLGVLQVLLEPHSILLCQSQVRLEGNYLYVVIPPLLLKSSLNVSQSAFEGILLSSQLLLMSDTTKINCMWYTETDTLNKVKWRYIDFPYNGEISS